MDNQEKNISNSGVEYIEKKDTKINQRKEKKMPKIKVEGERSNVRNVIWIIALFVIMFAVLMALPYISNYR